MTSAPELSPTVEVKSVVVSMSEVSEKALEHGIAVSRHYGAILYLVHVVSSLGFTLAGPEAIGLAAQASQRDMDCLLNRLLASGQLNGVEVRPKILTGNIDEEIDIFVREHCVDLVIAGSHGRKGIPRLVLGSVPQLIAKRCPCPVLTIGPQASSRPWIDNPEDCEKPLLLATASSMGPGRAMAFGIALAQNLNRPLFALQVAPSQQEAIRDTAHDGEAACSQLTAPSQLGIEVNFNQNHTFVKVGSDPAERILQSAEAIHAATIVLAAHHDELSYRPFRHSRNVIDHVNREAKCPVLTTRA